MIQEVSIGLIGLYWVLSFRLKPEVEKINKKMGGEAHIRVGSKLKKVRVETNPVHTQPVPNPTHSPVNSTWPMVRHSL